VKECNPKGTYEYHGFIVVFKMCLKFYLLIVVENTIFLDYLIRQFQLLTRKEMEKKNGKTQNCMVASSKLQINFRKN